MRINMSWSWLSRSIPMLLLVMFPSDTYCSFCPDDCTCMFDEYRCANGTVTIFANSYNLYLKCEETEVTCSDLPKLDQQYRELYINNCTSSILPCICDALEVSSIRLLKISGPRGLLKVEYLEEFQHLRSLLLYFDDDTTIPIAGINSLKYLDILLVFGGKLKLSGNTFNSTSLLWITLNNTEIDRFNTEPFNGLPNLEHLYLTKVEIENISAGFLKGLDSLQGLVLHQNNLKFIQVGAFASTPKLNRLEITDNPLLSLPDHLFDGLSSLDRVNIENKDIVFQCSDTSINIRNSSDENTISSTYIDTADTEWDGSRGHDCLAITFNNLTSLTYLELSNIKMSALSNVMFSNCPALEILYLQNNKIKEIPQNIFHGLAALRKLNLASNDIKILEDGLFSNLTALNVLILSNNVIEELTLNVFDGLKNLTQLDLSNNNIISIQEVYGNIFRHSVSPFRNLPNLLEIDLSHNKLSTIGYAYVDEMPHIRVINIANNRFKDLTDFWTIISEKNIILNLTNNNITKIILQQTLPKIKLEDQISNQSQLAQSSIYLDSNPFFCDCNNYDLFICATTSTCNIKLYLGNSTCSGPSQLKGRIMRKLSPSDLVCDLPLVCPNNCTCTFKPATTEVILDCNQMPTELPDIRDRIYSIIRSEDYKHNYTLNLNTQTDSLADLNITTLNISNTNVYNITFKPNDHLKVLDVSYNMLTTIPDAILKTNITLYVANNPLECDCCLVEELKEHRVADYRLVYCANGEALSNINAGRLCRWQLVLLGDICLYLMGVIFFMKIGITMYRYIKRKRFTISSILYRRGSDFSINMERHLDVAKEYDLFISFAHEDTEFVRDNLLPKLENDFKQSVCVHHRDWVAGELIEDQIIKSVESARRTVIILTEAFLLSEWSYLEFRNAHNTSIREGRPRVIMILLNEEIKNDERLSKAIKSYITVNTYLVWGDPDFWEKFKRVLPKRRR